MFKKNTNNYYTNGKIYKMLLGLIGLLKNSLPINPSKGHNIRIKNTFFLFLVTYLKF